MNRLEDSTDRRPLDYFSFGLCGFGVLVSASGVITLRPGVFIFGGIVTTFGIIYFLLLD